MATIGQLVKKYILAPWASGSGALKNDIPLSNSGLPSNRASWQTGFPEITMQPVLKDPDTNVLKPNSGIPASGYDFNGALNTISNEIYNQKLMGVGYSDWDSQVVANYGGYPKGAIVTYATGGGDLRNLYISLQDNNTNNPSSSTWKPITNAPVLTVYPTEQNINGSINCWTLVYPNGMIEQGGISVPTTPTDVNGQKIVFITPYKNIVMTVSVSSVGVYNGSDNNPANEFGWYTAPYGEYADISHFNLPYNLEYFYALPFRRSGSENDPTTPQWYAKGF